MKHFICTLLFTFTFYDVLSQDLLPFRLDSLWGYRDKQGAVHIQPQFQYASKFMNNVAIVVKGNKSGAIDRKNALIIPFRYEFLQPLDESEFLFGYRARYFGEYYMGVMTKDEKIKIPAEYRSISKQHDTYRVTKNTDSVMIKSPDGDIRSVKTFHGLSDINGKVLIPCRFSYISWISDSLLVVSKDESQALFNKKGEQLTSFDYMVFGDFIEGLAKARIGNKFGFVFPTGKLAIPFIFDYCEDFSKGHALIRQDDKWGAINKKGEVIIEPKKTYEEVKTELKEKQNR